MGADNLKDFHRWKNWRDIFLMLPIAVVDRGGADPESRVGARGHQLRPRPRSGKQALPACPACHPPAWVYLHGVKSDLSSTALQGKNKERLTMVESY